MKITLCGSSRFKAYFEQYARDLSLAGHLVYSPAGFGREASDTEKSFLLPLVTAEEKIAFDLIHLSKIEESDAILVLNVAGYTGISTKREIMWARMRGKHVYAIMSDVEIGAYKALELFPLIPTARIFRVYS